MAEISQVRHIPTGRVTQRLHGISDKIEINESSPIGMFDSGVGGLTVFDKTTQLLPNETIFYLADTARVPYGGRSPNEIIKINREIMDFYIALGVKMVVMACGTSSSIALPIMREKYKLPIIGMIEDAAKAAAAATKNKKVGVIATVGTINSGAHEKAIKDLDKAIEVTGIATPLLVPLIEGGFSGSTETTKVLKEYLKPLIQKKVDTLVLGCTHYPHLTQAISSIVGPTITLIDPAEYVARTIKETLRKAKMLTPATEAPKHRFFVTASANNFKELAYKLISRPIPSVEEVTIVKSPKGR